MFSLLVITLFLSVWLYLRNRIRHYIILPYSLPKASLYFFDFVLLATALFRYSYRSQGVDYHQSSIKHLFYLGYSSIGFFGYLCLFVLIVDLISLFLKKVNKSEIAPVEGRRTFLKRSLGLGSFFALQSSTAAMAISSSELAQLKKVEIVHPNLPDEFVGFKIAQISDLHLGPIIDKHYLLDVVNKVMSHGPDVIVFTGDMIDGHVEVLKDEFTPLDQLNAPHGKFFITGNHEYYWNAQNWIEFFESKDLTHLLNTSTVIERNGKKILLSGIPDPAGRKYFDHHVIDIEKAKSIDPSCDFNILLAHRPDIADHSHQYGYHLQLSGHTHGGQSFPFNIVVAMVQKYLSGFYQVQNMGLYVNQGTGYWGPPIRLFVPSEVSIISLQKGKVIAST